MADDQIANVLEIANVLAERVREARRRAGVNQWQLAEAAGVSNETISRIERGRFSPALPTLCRIAKALDVSLDHLVGLKDKPPPRETPSLKGMRSQRLLARMEQLTPTAQHALLTIIKLLPRRRRDG